MTISTKTTIKTFFETGDFPTQSNFSDFIDSCVFAAETSAQSLAGDISIGGIFSVSGVSTLGALNAASVNSAVVSGASVNGANANLTTLNSTTVNAAVVSAATVNPGNIRGTTTNNNASSGSVGEYIFSNVAPVSAVALSNGATANVTSVSLGAGDWNVWGTTGFSPGATTTQTSNVGAISLSSAILPSAPNNGAYANQGGVPTGLSTTFAVGMTRISLSTTANIFLVVNSTFAASTQKAYGFIAARRVR